ncbi:MAG: hypothetical protein ACR2JW_08590, partial [Thermomicrobiales bacterium]
MAVDAAQRSGGDGMQGPSRQSYRRAVAILVALVCALMPSAVSAYDWLQFNGDGRHGGNNSQETA